MLSDAGSLRKGSTHNQLVWILIQARAALLDISSQKKSRNASSICKQLSAIISHCQLPATPELCKLQMKVCTTPLHLLLLVCNVHVTAAVVTLSDVAGSFENCGNG